MYWLLVLACTTDSSTTSLHCSLDQPVLNPVEAAPGATVVATTGPLTAAFDTSVTLGSTAASVLSIDRTACDACDTCRDAASCTSCDECSSCAADCATCVETVSFTVPDVAPGSARVTVTNIHAASPATSFSVLAPSTDSGGDSGAR